MQTPTTAPGAGDLLDEREVCAALQISPHTARNWRWRDTGPRWHRIGARCIRYRRSDLDAFIASGASDAQA